MMFDFFISNNISGKAATMINGGQIAGNKN
jgi:hypothetical protein